MAEGTVPVVQRTDLSGNLWRLWQDWVNREAREGNHPKTCRFIAAGMAGSTKAQGELMYGQGGPVQHARLYLRRGDTDMTRMLAKLQRHPLVDDIKVDRSKISEIAPEECHESAVNVHFDVITGQGSRWRLTRRVRTL